MTGCTAWSYAPYRPYLTDVGELYICRIAPGETAVHVEWLPGGNGRYSVYCRRRGEDVFACCGETDSCEYDVTGLETETDYELQVRSGTAQSHIRLARCGKSIGTVVNYLHPDDEAYAFSGRYLCPPSLVRHPDGFLLASMDVYAAGHPQNLTLIFRSDDDGATWHYVSELTPCFWGKLFVHRGALYMLACSTEYGDLLIGRSDDGGRTFSAPVALLRGANGKNGSSGVHKNPQPLMEHNGRLYGTLEWGAWANKQYGHAAMVMSCDADADLLDPASWHFSDPVPFRACAPELAGLPDNTMTIEGTLAVDRGGKLLNVMRFGKPGTALCYRVNTDDPDAPLAYDRCIPFDGNFSKFTIRYDALSDRYYTIATRVYDAEKPRARNLLSLMVSDDLDHWRVVCDLHDWRDHDPQLIGFQYVDFIIEGDDLLYLCRTAVNGAHNFHDANYSTFHRIRRFRGL